MGTNYYLHQDACPNCGRSDDRLHIGKSSSGWCFSLHVDPSEGINSLANWQARWSKPGSIIVDECKQRVTPEQMISIIRERSGRVTAENMDLKANDAELGPNGLARHRLGRHCVGHGDGTYDLIPGEFC